MGSKKKMIVVVSMIALAIGVAVFFYFLQTQTRWIESDEYKREGAQPARTLVVVYSRTGNTLGAAKEAASFFDADLLKIDASAYPRTLKGQLRAAKDADEEVTTTPITHDPVDLENYDLIILCSPTWWFRPAPPLWSFVENHDFQAKSVFLMLTGNSRLKDELTDKFGTLVEKKNGKFLDKLFIQRGRIYWQKTPDEIHAEVKSALNARAELWPESTQVSQEKDKQEAIVEESVEVPALVETKKLAGLVYFEAVRGDAKKEDTLPLVVSIHGKGDKPDVSQFLDFGFPVRVVWPQATS